MTAMYETFFNLNRRPFGCVPRAEQYFPAAGIEAARATLTRCIERAEGVGLLVGPAGTGKTLLCQLLAEQFTGPVSGRPAQRRTAGARAAACSRPSSTNWDSPIAAWTRASCGWRWPST